ncbi:uncharacterized protein LOC141648121 [Silene latifolia]|uniref:uncharacterized protein LOC141648121 n=1 Tax=Silene latifolia TaxID=37657 RepID=UPI003D775A80
MVKTSFNTPIKPTKITSPVTSKPPISPTSTMTPVKTSYAFPPQTSNTTPSTNPDPPSPQPSPKPSDPPSSDDIPIATMVGRRTRGVRKKSSTVPSSSSEPVTVLVEDVEDETEFDLNENPSKSGESDPTPEKKNNKRKEKASSSQLPPISETFEQSNVDNPIDDTPIENPNEPPQKKSKPSKKKLVYLGPSDPVSLISKWDLAVVWNHLESIDLPTSIYKNCERLMNIKAIHSPRVYNQTWFDPPAFHSVRDMVLAQGWEKLLEMREPVFVSEVIQFFATVRVDKSGETLTAKVNGKPLKLSQSDFATALGIPVGGYDKLPSETWVALSYASPLSIAQTVCPKTVSPGPVSNTQIPPPLRIIFNMLCRSIYPSGDRGKLTIAIQYLIYHIATHKKVNLVGLMFKRFHLISTKLRRPSSSIIYLPYGMWLSVVLKAQGVLVNTSLGSLDMYDVMSDGQMGKMLIKIENDALISVKIKKDPEVGSSSQVNAGGMQEVLNAVAELGAWLKEDACKKDLAISALASTMDLIRGEVDIISTLVSTKEVGDDHVDDDPLGSGSDGEQASSP